MGLFSRRSSRKALSAFDTGHTGDDLLLQTLYDNSDLNSPRHWVHYLYFPEETSARAWALSIESAGWALHTVAPAATDDGQWIVIPERHDVVISADAVRDARIYFESIAAQVDRADYDGWEASL